jgi:enoyl-CoA hydratase
MSGEVITEQDGPVLLITINRPQVRNAVNAATARGIAAALDGLDSRADLSVAVLTGAGGTFCAGMDLKAFLAGERPTAGHRGFAGIVENPPAKPVVAAVEGAAVAGGFEIALACDLIVAAENARFGLPEVKRGLVAGGGGLMRLARHVPYHCAVEWALTGDYVSAAEARAAGLVSRITAAGDALAQAVDLARRIAGNGPLALAATKRILAECQDWPLAEQFARQREISEPVRESQDAREGARAFVEKRAPQWAGR